jgi:hypothetical protein
MLHQLNNQRQSELSRDTCGHSQRQPQRHRPIEDQPLVSQIVVGQARERMFELLGRLR